MKIAGIYWYDSKLDPKIQHAVSEPYGLEKILAVAEAEGHQVELFLPLEKKREIVMGKEVNHFVSLTEEELVERVADYHPDLACFSLYTCQYPAGKRIATELKKRDPKIINIAGNRYPTYLGMKNQKVEPPFDFFVVQEGEEKFQSLLRVLFREPGLDFQDISLNASSSASPNTVPHNHLLEAAGNRIQNLDHWPKALRFPLVLEQVYQGISIPPLSKNPHYALMESSRGCAGLCKFCDNQTIWQGKITYRSPEKVVEEMFELAERGVNLFYFIDLNFTASSRRAEQLCQEMLDQRLNASWYCMSNIETADGKKDMLALMKEAGCFKIAWGVESTSNASLQRMDKKISGRLMRAEQVQRVLEDSLQAGMLNQGYYIIGFPWEDDQSIVGDAEGLKYLPLHQLNVGIFTPIPFSGFYSEDLELDPNLEKHDRNHLVYSHPSLTHQSLKIIQQQMHRNFYSSPEYIQRIKTSCRLDPRFRQAFNDYFEHFGQIDPDGGARI